MTLTFSMLFASLLSLYGSMYQQLCMHVFLWPLCMHQPGSFRKFDSCAGTTQWGSLDQALPPQMFVIRSVSSCLGSLSSAAVRMLDQLFVPSMVAYISFTLGSSEKLLLSITTTKEVFLIKVSKLLLLSQHLLSRLHYYVLLYIHHIVYDYPVFNDVTRDRKCQGNQVSLTIFISF